MFLLRTAPLFLHLLSTVVVYCLRVDLFAMLTMLTTITSYGSCLMSFDCLRCLSFQLSGVCSPTNG